MEKKVSEKASIWQINNSSPPLAKMDLARLVQKIGFYTLTAQLREKGLYLFHSSQTVGLLGIEYHALQLVANAQPHQIVAAHKK